MPYNVKIKNERGGYLRGTVYYYDADGNEIGQTVVYPSGTDLNIELVNSAEYFRAAADGYSWYGASIFALGDTNEITLVEKEPTMMFAVFGVLAGLLLSKLFPKLFKF